MEITLTLPICTGSSSSDLFLFHSKPSSLPASTTSLPFYCSKSIPRFQGVRIKTKQQRALGVVGPIYASNNTQIPPTDVSEKWLLEPIGDGDTKHIGYKVDMPNAYEISSEMVTVGRLPEKADLVIPVATVSGQHARIRTKEGNLLVTDLDSTNGTFIDDRRLKPGVVAILSPGSSVTFGDEHLAVFRVSKLENVEAKVEIDIPTVNTEAS